MRRGVRRGVRGRGRRGRGSGAIPGAGGFLHHRRGRGGGGALAREAGGAAPRARLGLADPEIVAVTGWTTDELSAGIERADPQGPYGLVTLLIGVNNQYRGRPLDEYRGELHVLLRRVVGYAGGDAGRVVIVSIPDWSLTPYAESRDRAQIAREIDAFNAVARGEAEAVGAAWVDVTADSRRHGGDPTYLAADGLHPSGAAYDEWTELILPTAAAAVGSSYVTIRS